LRNLFNCGGIVRVVKFLQTGFPVPDFVQLGDTFK
jgi:hypothetical protein